MKHFVTKWNRTLPAEQQLRSTLSEFRNGSWKSLLLHVYCGTPDDSEQLLRVLRELRAAFPTAEIAGTVSAGEMRSGRLAVQSIIVSAMLFESTDAKVLRFDHVKGHESEIGKQICGSLNRTPDIKAAELLLPGALLDTRILFDEIEKCRPEIQIFGGYSGGHTLDCPQHFVFDQSELLEDSVIVVTYAGRDFAVSVGKSIGWQPLGLPFHVTKADHSRLIELDGHPAADIYNKYLQIDTEHDSLSTFEFPLFVRDKEEEMLRGVIGIEPDGTLDLAGYVNEGMETNLCYGNPTGIIAEVNHRLNELREFRPEAILLYSCLVRKTFWGEYVNMESTPFEVLATTAGFHTWGEVRRNMESGTVYEHNITLISIAMREGDAESKKLPPAAAVDDSMMRSQASLMNRISCLASATSDALQQAYQDLERLNRDLSRMNEKLTYMAERDFLTELYNRGKIESLINRALDHSTYHGRPVSLVMADIDFFKKVNDTYGHAAGDKVLRELAKVLKDAIGGYADAAVGRWGGEEFFLLLPDVGEAEALAMAENLRIRIENHHFPAPEHLTISMGVITVAGDHVRKTVLRAVDDALYQAKEAGRNRVVQYRG